MGITHHTSSPTPSVPVSIRLHCVALNMLLHLNCSERTCRPFLLGIASKNSVHSRAAAHLNSQLQPCTNPMQAETQPSQRRGQADMKPRPYPRSHWQPTMRENHVWAVCSVSLMRVPPSQRPQDYPLGANCPLKGEDFST